MRKGYWKGLLSFAVAVGMLLSVICIPAAALEQEKTSGTVLFNAEDTGAEFDGYLVKRSESYGMFSLSESDSEDASDPCDEVDGVEALEYAEGYYLADTLEAAKELAEFIDVEYIEPNYIVHMYNEDMLGILAGQPSSTANDIHLATINAAKVREYGITGEDLDTETDMGSDGEFVDPIVVAVIDSGLDTDHEDIDYTHVLEGANFVQSSTTSTADTYGHGTFVTGEILAATGNGLGIDGIVEDVYAMPIKVFVSNSTTTAVVVSAVKYATEQKMLFDVSDGAEGTNICVINMSLGSEGASTSLKTAVENAIGAGIIVICAAGNDGDTTASYPAQYAIGVGSTDADGGLDGYAGSYTQVLSDKNGTGWKNKVWVAAPGTYYTSLWYTGGYYYGSGTSFSSPQVAALAAIAVSLKNDLTSYYPVGTTVDNGDGAQISTSSNHYAFKKLLQETSNLTDYNSASSQKYNGGATEEGQDTRYGWGVVDFDKMVTALVGEFSGETDLSFNVANAAGTALTAEKNNLSISIYPCDVSGTATGAALEADENGVYVLTQGERYHYAIVADKYIACESDFVAILPERTLNIVLEGQDYYTSFTVYNTDGEKITDPTIQVYKDSGAEVEQNTDDDSFTTKNGTYSYTASAAGYFPTGGNFTIDDEENEYEEDRYTVSVTLTGAQDVCSVTFDVQGTDGEPYGEVTLTDGSGNVVEPYIDGAWKLESGGYSYVVESDYYQTVEGILIITDEDKGTSRVESVLMDARLYWAFIDVLPLTVAELDSTVIEVKNISGDVVDPFNNAKGEYRITDGKYTYTIKAEGYKTATGRFAMAGELLYIDVELVEGNDDSSSGTISSGTSNGGVSDDKTDPKPEIGKYIDIETEYHVLDDVKPGDWFYESVNFTMTVGLFQGSTPATFLPYTDMTRAMLVTVLYRLSGDEAPEAGYSFTDVAADAYYADAVAWASENGIVKGVSESNFAPEMIVTREQIAVLLCRYADWAGFDTAVMSDGAALAFDDYDDVSTYAVNGVNWAYEQKIVQGNQNGSFCPLDGATRAEVAAMFTRFLKNVL